MYLVNTTSKAFNKKVSKAKVGIIPIGSVEAHGIHAPLGTDIFAPRLIASRLDAIAGDRIWIAPEVAYGQCDYLTAYPGSITMPSQVLADYVYYIAKGMFENNIEKIVFLNGHGGNVTALKLASEMLAKLGATVVTVNWWMDYSKDILKITETQGHAGEDETSAMLYYDKNLVDMSDLNTNNYKPKFYVYFKERGDVVLKHAITGDPHKATYEKGKKIFEMLDDKMLELLEYLEKEKYLNK